MKPIFLCLLALLAYGCVGIPGWSMDEPIDMGLPRVVGECYPAENVADRHTAELCDRVDNDCDGSVDEGYLGQLGTTCSVGTGECRREGTYICAADGRGVRCVVRPGAPVIDTIGDLLDNDCDGFHDEQVYNWHEVGHSITEGFTACQEDEVCPDHHHCIDDFCQNPGGVTDELCNGMDDDGDGETDEDYFRQGVLPAPEYQLYLGEECAAGAGVCGVVFQAICSPDGLGVQCLAIPGEPYPQGEGIRDRDDDCDGRIDEAGEDDFLPDAGMIP